MAIDPEFRGCFKQKINVAKATGISANGFSECVFGAPAEQDARVEPQNRIVNSSSGEEQVSDTMIMTEFEITENDRVWLPGVDSTDDALARLPKLVEIGTDFDGTPHHYEVSL